MAACGCPQQVAGVGALSGREDGRKIGWCCWWMSAVVDIHQQAKLDAINLFVPLYSRDARRVLWGLHRHRVVAGASRRGPHQVRSPRYLNPRWCCPQGIKPMLVSSHRRCAMKEGGSAPPGLRGVKDSTSVTAPNVRQPYKEDRAEWGHPHSEVGPTSRPAMALASRQLSTLAQ